MIREAIQGIGFRYGYIVQAKPILRTFLWIYQAKGTFPPISTASYKDVISLQFWCLSLIQMQRAHLRVKPSKQESDMTKEVRETQ